ncbi:hypothetical protein MtrunA17_Chr6g0484801 [Medicago truncatula]|uniref:Uncharacterized protein n=1 Tax=Medicago truncatula TaxID=3880 RepID=A0A396HLS1_MEDTR|nr:hypothetical protein MtrunA17_Chr6g0484801 [Medicago truncatula]
MSWIKIRGVTGHPSMVQSLHKRNKLLFMVAQQLYHDGVDRKVLYNRTPLNSIQGFEMPLAAM